MRRYNPDTWLSNLDGDGYGDATTYIGEELEMVITNRMTPLQAAATIIFMLGTNGTSLQCLADDGKTQLRGKHIFDHARAFIIKHRGKEVTGVKHGDTITVDGKKYREVG